MEKNKCIPYKLKIYKINKKIKILKKNKYLKYLNVKN